MEIYAEITKKQLRDIESGKLKIPDIEGVDITNKKGTRGFFFDCEGQYSFEATVEFLDSLAISWQEN